MATALDRFDQFISLGYICTVDSMLMKLRKKTQTHVFDNVAVPAWAVHELIANDFAHLFQPENMECKVLFDNTITTHVVDTRYNIRLPFPEKDSQRLLNFKADTERRAQRLLQLLGSGSSGKVLFIRHEEQHQYSDLGNRIPNPAYDAKYAVSEREWLKLTCETLKTKYPILDFKILFFNSAGEFVDDNIIGIGLPACNYRDHRAGSLMVQKLTDHSAFLAAHLL